MGEFEKTDAATVYRSEERGTTGTLKGVTVIRSASRWFPACCVGLPVLFLVWPAQADIGDSTPPPPCKVEEYLRDGWECGQCPASEYDRRCEKRVRPRGYNLACRTSGRSDWTEVWCREKVKSPSPCAQPLAGKLQSVTASSAAAGTGGASYNADSVVDGDLSTSWQPKSARGGVGEWIQLNFTEEVLVSSVSIANGYQQDDFYGDEFLLNGRVKSAVLIFSDGSRETIAFPATERGCIDFTVRLRATKTLRLQIKEVTPGDKWPEVALSEMTVRSGKEAPQGPGR